MELERNIDVLVLGYYGFGNLGDELLSKAVVDNLLAAGIEKKRIVLLSGNVAQSEALTGVKCFDRWNLGTVSVLMKQSKSFLLGGGGLFQDSTSVKSCGYYWWMTRTAKMSKTKLWAVSQSVGPLRSMLGKWFTKNALKKCAYLSVRDDNSSQLLSSWNIAHSKAADLVLSLPSNRLSCNGDTLLLNLRPGYSAAAEIAIKQANFIAKREKLKITGVALAKEDEVYLENIEAEGQIKFKNVVLLKDIPDFENVAKTASKAIGMRLHFAELCAMHGLPILSAAYDPKVQGFCEQWKLPIVSEKLTDDYGIVSSEKMAQAKETIETEFKHGLAAVLSPAEGA